jgi:hypothetical protein
MFWASILAQTKLERGEASGSIQMSAMLPRTPARTFGNLSSAVANLKVVGSIFLWKDLLDAWQCRVMIHSL